MYAIDICEGSGQNPEYTDGIIVFKFKDCCKKVDFYTLSEIMFKFDKSPRDMTYDEYLIYAITVIL